MIDLNIEKRKEVLALLEDMRVEFKTIANAKPGKPGQPKVKAKFNSMTNQLFDILLKHFHPTSVPTCVTQDDIIVEIHHMLRNNGSVCEDESVWMECYNPTFAAMITRCALKDYRLPIIQASGWKPFARKYAALVMAA